jgi:hypothetical protein
MTIEFDGDAFSEDVDDALDELEDLQDRYTGGGTWVVGSAVEYAIYLEMGTRDLDPKPFLRPAIHEARQSLRQFVADNTSTTLDAIETADELVRTVAFALERRVKEIITEKGLIDTGALRASVAAVPLGSPLPPLSDVAARSDVDLDPEDI